MYQAKDALFFIAKIARYAIGADLAPVMRAQVSGLETSSERKCVVTLRPVACISVEEGAKKGIKVGIGALLCKNVHGGLQRAHAVPWDLNWCKNHAELLHTQKRRPCGRLGSGIGLCC